MEDILMVENLIELHEKLNEFAEHHQNKGGQMAHKLIKEIWDNCKRSPRSGHEKDIIRDEGFDAAFEAILKELRRKFIP